MSPRTEVVAQLASIKNHLSSASPDTSRPQPTKNMTASRPPITCHVLDTTIGAPAEGIAVKLYPSSSTSSLTAYTGTTNNDGRVTEWIPPSNHITLLQAFEGNPPRDLHWVLEFETGEYWKAKGIEPFFPRVSLQFVTESFSKSHKGKEAHWHVPLLLGPYNYTTYRGS